jgi:hypothetical protein
MATKKIAKSVAKKAVKKAAKKAGVKDTAVGFTTSHGFALPGIGMTPFTTSHGFGVEFTGPIRTARVEKGKKGSWIVRFDEA